MSEGRKQGGGDAEGRKRGKNGGRDMKDEGKE